MRWNHQGWVCESPWLTHAKNWVKPPAQVWQCEGQGNSEATVHHSRSVHHNVLCAHCLVGYPAALTPDHQRRMFIPLIRGEPHRLVVISGLRGLQLLTQWGDESSADAQAHPSNTYRVVNVVGLTCCLVWMHVRVFSVWDGALTLSVASPALLHAMKRRGFWLTVPQCCPSSLLYTVCPTNSARSQSKMTFDS